MMRLEFIKNPFFCIALRKMLTIPRELSTMTRRMAANSETSQEVLMPSKISFCVEDSIGFILIKSLLSNRDGVRKFRTPLAYQPL